MYFFLVSDVPQMEMLLMRWGYACVKYRSLSMRVGRSLFAYLSLCMKGQSLRMMLLMVWSCLSVFWTVRLVERMSASTSASSRRVGNHTRAL